MAQTLPVNPEVTIDNADDYLEQTQGVVNVITNTDIPHLESGITTFENHLTTLSNFYDTQYIKYRIFSKTRPTTLVKGMAWFIQS